MKTVLLLAALASLCLAASSSAQPASNDNFANAIPLVGPVVTTTANNSTATREGGFFNGEPFHANNLGGASLWWTWTAAASGPTTIDTLGSDFNTLLAVYTGTVVNQLTPVASNNDFEGNLWSRVQFNAVGGTVYRVVVDGFSPGFPPNPARGNIVLNVKGVGGVEVTSPTNGAVFTVGESIPVNVTITPDFPNPPATRVDFYVGNAIFASSDTAPFTAVATTVPAGSNTIYAVATSSTGQLIQSPVVPIFVQKIGVTILTPFEDTVFQSATNPITVTAWSYLPSGTMTNVEFYVDNVRIGEDDSFPYSAAWTNVTPGSHRITAIGRSDAGLAYNSQPVNIGVVTVLVPFATVWKYLDDGSDQGTAWIAPNFDDSAWLSGPAPLGYSDSNGRLPATTNSFGPNPNAKWTNTYYRTSFIASNLSTFTHLALGIERDDGAVVYLNGAEIGRFNMPTGLVTSTTPASSNAGDDGGTIFALNLTPSLFLEGLNTFAVEIHQDSPNSSDTWFQMRLLGVPIIIHNLSPLVDITNLTSGQYFLAPPNITIAAEASDPDGSVAKVTFFADGAEIGEATSAPYSVVWNSPSVAAHVLTAVATDDLGAITTSAEVPIVVYDALGTPVAAIASPGNGAIMEGPTNLLVTATVNAIAGVTNVEFYANDVEFGSDASPPYGAMWAAPFGTNLLTAVATDANGVRGTSPVATVTITIPPTNVIAPRIFAQIPVGGATITNLTNITVTFSEFVQNIDAADLLINGVPATGVNANHSRSNYTFTFAHPPYGPVTITFAPGHGITDYGWPTVLPFDETEGATWTYTLIDRTAPTIAARTPAPSSTVTNLKQITVIFSEAVTGVDASDLLVNGGPAFAMDGGEGDRTYIFHVSQPASGTVNVTWATNNNIFDEAAFPNAFNRSAPGAAWSFTLDNRVVLMQSNSVWRFVKGTEEASYPTNAWRQPDYDDSGWSNAAAPFFFGDPYTNATIRGTLLSDMLGNYSTIYLRQEFTVNNRGNITNLLLNAQSDDGFIAWINGVEVRRFNVGPGEQAYNAVATAASQEPQNNGAGYVVAILPPAAVAALVDGRNVLTVHAFNQSLTNSTDFGFNAQLYYFPVEPGTVPPRLLTPSPAPGDVLYLTNITITFSEPVTGVDQDDLLINGQPAGGITSTTNTTYTFHFSQPPYGPVAITWQTNHGIVDFDGPPKAFDGNALGSSFNYALINPSNPRVLTQAPLAGSTVTGLTAIVVTFTEPVFGVEAADFQVNGASAISVTTDDATSYRFSFAQPPFGSVAIRWASNHAIVDVEAGNPFEPARFGGQWNYSLVDPAPSVTITSPTNNTYRLEPATVTVAATATDNDGTIASVAFYSGADLIGQSTNAPYSVGLSNLVQGVYVLRAVAIDNMGLLGTSAPVVLNVVTSLPAVLIRGPYLQMGTPTGGVVRWRTDVITDGLVNYGTDPQNLTNYAVELSVTNEHIVKISGLEPSTRYYYSIGSAAQRLAGTNGIGSDYWFDTSPPTGARKPTRLWILGDAGTAGNGAPDRQQSTRNAFYDYAAATGEPDLWLMLGDNAYNVGSDVEHQRAVFDMYPRTLRNKFLWPTLGNHETSMSTTATDFPYLHIFSLPQNGEAGGIPSGTEKYYSFDYANIHFVCLDSMTSGQTADTPMANWLRNDLAATTAEWIIVFFHHPPYTKGSHDSDAEQDLVRIRQNLVPIMESHGVDLVLSGHSHCYERSYLLHGHYGLTTTLTPSMKIDGGDGRADGTGPYRKNDQNQGVVYTVAGSSGQATFLTGDTPPAHFITILQLGSMVVDIYENRLDAIFLRETGEIQDRFTLLKPDLRPAAPLNLVALPAGPTQVGLSWTDVSTNETGYLVERSINGTQFAQVLAVDADATSALDSGLQENVTYHYRVRGTNFAGVSEPSNIASVRTVPATGAPNAPANLAANANQDEDFYRSQIILRWVDLSGNEAAFLIERSVDALQFIPVASVAANSSVYIDRGLDSATFYFYRVRAVNSVGQSAPTGVASDQTHPQSQLATAGQTVTFHAGVEGAPGVRYQWRFNDGDLPGETNQALVITNVWVNHNGEYAVLLRDNNGPRLTKEALLTVAASPRITSEPQGGVFEEGVPFQLSVTAEGSLPLAYTWRKNGAAIGIPGNDRPTLDFPVVHVSDQGSYDVIVSNTYGAATSRVATLSVAADPVLAQMPNIDAEVLRPVIFRNTVTDPNVPPLNLVYSLSPGAPTNAWLDPGTGLFAWTPNRSQAPGSNDITVNVADRGNASLQSSMTFTIRVNDYVEMSLGSMIIRGSTNGSVPVALFTSIPLAEAQAVIHFPEGNFTDVTFQRGGLASTSVIFEKTSIGTITFTFVSGASGGIVGMNQIGTLRFATGPAPESTIARLEVASLIATPIDPIAQPTLVGSDGRVIIAGTRPLLDAHFTPQGRELTLLGLPGNYILEFVTNLNQTVWTRRGGIVSIPTNYIRLVPLGNNPSTNVPAYFRLRQ